MDKKQIIELIREKKLIVIVRGIAADKLIPLAEAMYEGGVRLLEVTYDQKKRVTDEETAEAIKALSTHFGERMIIGAGTVLTKKQVELTKNAGGRFIISPDFYEPVVRATVENSLVSIPGVLTPTEITTAVRAGADFVKLFPAGNMGPGYVKAISAPLSNVELLAVGGIDLDNMKEYQKAGVKGFGIGSGIVKKEMVDSGDFEAITAYAKKYVDLLSE